jgi:hypothetical protein
MKTAAATAMRLGAPGAILLALGFPSSAHAEEYLKSYSVTGRADVHVHVDDSSVHILTSDTQQIEFNSHQEHLSAAIDADVAGPRRLRTSTRD